MRNKPLDIFLATLMMVVSMSAYALDKFNGVYQIRTADDFKAFAELVNGGDTYACAELTADIDLGTDGTMIGSDTNRFRGQFDGKGHTITVNFFPKADGQALFRNIEGNALVQNLKVKGTITTSKKQASGIAAWGRGTIRNCWVDLTVVSSVAGDATHSGIVAVASEGLVIENCLSQITVNGKTTENCGGVVGWADGNITVSNCLVINDGDLKLPSDCGTISRNSSKLTNVNLTQYNGGEGDGYNWRPRGANYNNYATTAWGNTSMVTVISQADLESGKICYQLNNDQSAIAWVQDLVTDQFPVPAVFSASKKQVYASGATGCDGKANGLTYSNTGTVQAAAHTTDKFGICTTCGHMELEKLPRDKADNSYIAKTASDLDWLEGRNRVNNGGWFNISLGNDIEYVAVPGQLIFNTENWFGGSLDGNGHALTIKFTDAPIRASIFPHFRGSIQNLVVHGSITTAAQYAGSLVGDTHNDNMVIRNVFSDVDIYTTRSGDNTSGGLIGVADSKVTIENTIYAGNVIGVEGDGSECLAGLCGWAAGQVYLTNCAFLGTLQNELGDSKTLSRNPGNITCTNVFIANSYGYEDEVKATLIEDPDDIASGALAYVLNEYQGGLDRFYQKLGEDEFPIPVKKEGALVYPIAGQYRCDGRPIGEVSYSNMPSPGGVLPPHQFEEGFCTVCEGLQENYMTPVDGWFDISSGNQLVWWTNYAAKHLDVSARLTADIDMDGYCDRWANVGTKEAPFYGNFDGQFHTISNLVIEHKGDNGVGLISVMNSLPSKGFGGLSDEEARNSEGVYIKNVTLDESCQLIGRGYVALVGMTAPWAGHVNIKGVMMCGNVKADGGLNAAGIFGCVMGSACHVTIDNCGMIGNVYGLRENASLSSWLGDYAEVTNCFTVGSVEGFESNKYYFARYSSNSDSVKIHNCYTLNGSAVNNTNTEINQIEKSDIYSGKLTYLLNESKEGGENFYQIIGVDSIPGPFAKEGGKVYSLGNGIYSNASGTYIYINNTGSDINTQTIEAEGSTLVEIGLSNISSDLVAFQMDLTLPEGVSIDKDGCSLSSRITDEEQELTIGKLENGTYRLTSSSLSLTHISGNEGTLLTLKLTAESGSVGGQATIGNIRFSTSESERVTMNDETFDVNVMYKVIYKVDGEEYKTVNVLYNTPIAPETGLTKEGYTFSGWSEIPDTMPAHNVVVTGNFTINKYKLTYMVGGVEYKTYEINYATTITPEVEPTQVGYTFSGWIGLPETMPARDVEVTGAFTINSYTLTYLVDGEEYKTSSVVYGTELTLEAEPTKHGYTFGGWSELPETMPARNVEVTGQFYLYGDVNTDEEVDVVDVVDVARFVVATPSAKFREKLADLNFDNTVNIGDAVVLVNHIAGDQNFAKELFAPEHRIDTSVLSLTRNGKNLALNLANGQAYTAFQFDLYVSEDADVVRMMLNGQRQQKHQLLYNKVEDGHYRVAALSTSNNTFLGKAGELLSLVMDDALDADVEIVNIHFFDTKGNDYVFDTIGVDQETGVNNVNGNNNVNDNIYDLQGRKLSKLQRGVNVIGGKKVLVK